MHVKLAVAALIVWILVPAQAVAEGDEQDAFRVIAHSTVAVDSISKVDLSKIFLKKKSRWDDGNTAKPVDQAPDSKVREVFTRTVSSKSVAALRSYWRQKIFSGGGVPPPEKGDDAETLAYIVKTPGAVGYVNKTAPTKGAKILTLTD